MLIIFHQIANILRVQSKLVPILDRDHVPDRVALKPIFYVTGRRTDEKNREGRGKPD